MGYFAPLIASVFLLGFLAIFIQESQVTAMSSSALATQNSGQTFVAYRNAVMTYQQNNPSFVGTVPNATIGVTGAQFSAAFFSRVSNVVVATGVRNGRVVICYGSFVQSVATQAALASNNDASFGVANGTTWISAAVGAPITPMPLASNIPSGNIVSVMEVNW